MTEYSREMAVRFLAAELAKSRTGGDVFMDGSSDPLPSEYQRARAFLALYDAGVWHDSEAKGEDDD